MTRLRLAISFAAVLAAAAPASANLIVNGGFETGDFTGWTQTGNLGDTFVDGDPHSGDHAAWLGPIGSNGFLSQILTTVPGDTYTIGFWLKSDGGLPNNFSVSWNGSSSFSIINLSTLPYTQFFVSVVATGTSTPVKFGFRNDPGYLRLDDVTVVDVTVPEPSSVYLLLLGGSIAAFAFRRRSA